MPVFKIIIKDPKAYLHSISGITQLTKTESEVLGEIISFMQSRKLTTLDDDVKNHIINKFNFKHIQSYYNLINVLRKKKLLLNSHHKIQLKPILLSGTTLEIQFQEPEPVEYNLEEHAQETT